MAERIARCLEDQRPNFFLWTPVFLGSGAGLYFALPFEPSLPAGLWMLLGIVGVLGLRYSGNLALRVFIWIVMLVAAGLLLASLRTHQIAAPVLAEPFVGAIEGRVVSRDLSARNRVRIVLDNVTLYGVEPEATPERVRVTLGPVPDWLRAGRRVLVHGQVSPPGPPVEPGGFDFRRWAWFKQLGGVGFSLGPVLPALAPAEGGSWIALQEARAHLAERLIRQVEGSAGGFAAAILVGYRGAVGQADLDALRASNLAHLLAISGLHMGLLTGLVFAAVRLLLAMVPRLAMRVPAKSLAAAAAILAGLAYLAFSGASVATQRAFVMAAVAFLAVIISRPAITLRAVALAALAILILRPESVTQAGFQMSFAATVGLVAGFEALRRTGWMQGRGPLWQRPLRWFAALVFASALAGTATAPISAFHFNQMAQYGLVANVLAVPLMGSVVMPLLLLGLLLEPIGLGGAAYFGAGLGIDGILAVAHWIAGLEGSVFLVPDGPAVILPMIAIGTLVVVIWRGRWRFAGIVPAAVAIAIWFTADRPPVLIDESGRLIGVMGEAGRGLSLARGKGFVAESWLESDGDAAEQALAAKRMGDAETFDLDGWRLSIVEDGTHWGSVPCGAADVVLDRSKEPVRPAGDCIVVTLAELKARGAMALHGPDAAVRVRGARDGAARPWTGGR